MIEAVNSVLQTAPVNRASSEQTSTVDSFAGNPDRVQKVPLAPYISPYIHMDVNYDKAILQLRNSETGDVEGQFPSQSQLEAQARAAARRQSESQASQPRQEAPRTEGTQQERSAPVNTNNISARQQAAFEAAARSGNSNAGNITLFA